MINILSSRTIFNREDVVSKLKKYIKKDSKICVIAFSFFMNGFDQKAYEKSYQPIDGIWYKHIVDPFRNYGVNESNFDFIIYNVDSKDEARKKIESSDIIFLPGGAPELFFSRLQEYDLVELLKSQNKVIMGPSAGSMIQCNWFHISKDRDYKKFMTSDGIGYISDFGVEVHFNRRKQQKKSIRRVSHMNKRPIYTIHEDGYMIIEDGKIIDSYQAFKYYENGRKVK